MKRLAKERYERMSPLAKKYISLVSRREGYPSSTAVPTTNFVVIGQQERKSGRFGFWQIT